MRLFLLIIVLLGMMSGAGPAMDDVKIDIEKFEGTWKVVSGEEIARRSYQACQDDHHPSENHFKVSRRDPSFDL
jgi:hypothetical protein